MLEANVDNALALVDIDKYGEPLRLIVYNINWLSTVHSAGGISDDAWRYVRFFVIGHEIGHHVCKHTAGRLNGLPWDKELEADGFAGAMVRNLGNEQMWSVEQTDLPRLLRAAQSILSDADSSPSHPPLRMRLTAIADGWKNGSRCQ
jgi:hypothetical protein